jgi:hypothetical protein
VNLLFVTPAKAGTHSTGSMDLGFRRDDVEPGIFHKHSKEKMKWH